MHIYGLTWLLWAGFITLVSGQKQVINFAFFYPFFTNELPHPETYNITSVVEYGIDLFNKTALGEKYELKMTIFNSDCSAEGGNRVYIDMLQNEQNYSFIVGEFYKPNLGVCVERSLLKRQIYRLCGLRL